MPTTVMKQPSQEEIEQYNEGLLREFITKDAQGNAGMVLIALKEDENSTTVSLRAGASVNNMYRAAGAILESLISDNKISGTELPLIKSIVGMLGVITNDIEPSDVEEALAEADAAMEDPLNQNKRPN